MSNHSSVISISLFQWLVNSKYKLSFNGESPLTMAGLPAGSTSNAAGWSARFDTAENGNKPVIHWFSNRAAHPMVLVD